MPVASAIIRLRKSREQPITSVGSNAIPKTSMNCGLGWQPSLDARFTEVDYPDRIKILKKTDDLVMLHKGGHSLFVLNEAMSRHIVRHCRSPMARYAAPVGQPDSLEPTPVPSETG